MPTHFRKQFARAGRLVAMASVACVLCLATAADAMRVSPMVAELTTTGAGSSARIEVGNVGSEALPFETLMTEIHFDEDGVLTETPSDDNFLVFPPQGVVPVGGRQVVRVQWVGEPQMAASRAFYMAVRQLPVQTEAKEPESGGAIEVKVLYRFKALIVVAPPGATPRIEVSSVKAAEVTQEAPAIDAAVASDQPASAPSQPGLEVVVVNSGTRYALMSGANWVIEGTGQDGTPARVVLAGNQISESVGVGYVAPSGGKRTFKVPTGVAFDDSKPISVNFTR